MNTQAARSGTNSARIKALSAEDIAQIKSSIQITSLRDVVLGLLCNALDAGSRSISIHVHINRGSCTVEDDGIGISPLEFLDNGGLLKAYHTSKTFISSTHGRSGCFLASLSGVSLLGIESRYSSTSVASSLTAHQSKIVARDTSAIPDSTRSTSGTKITVRNLFGNMPVRVKHRALAAGDTDIAEWAQLVHDVVHFMLAWPSPVIVSLQDETSGKKVQLRPRQGDSCSKIESMLSMLTQASIISPGSWASWVPISAKTSKIQIKGAISLDPATTKQQQFVSIGFRPILNIDQNNELYLQINRQFAESRFGVLEDEELSEAERLRRSKDRRFKQDGPTNKQVKGLVKGVDRWPMFYLRIDISDDNLLSGAREQSTEGTGQLHSIMKVIEAMVLHWLVEHAFKPRKKALTDGERASTGVSSASSQHPSLHASSISARHHLDGSDIDDTALAEAAISGSIARSVQTGSSDASAQGGARKEAESSNNMSAFQTWSRIKSGQADLRRKVIDEKALNEPSVNAMPKPPADLCKEEQSLADEGNIGAMTGNDQDSWTTWRDPATNTVYDLNVRSGLLVPAPRSKTAPSRTTGDTVSPHGDRRSSTSSSLRLESRKTPKLANIEPASWLQKVASKWQNPVFRPAEQSVEQIPLADCGQDGGGGCNHSHGQPNSAASLLEARSTEHRLTSGDLKNAQVVSQLENKFILIKLPQQSQLDDNLLVIVDQHAVDERYRVEDLLKDLCKPNLDGIPLRSNLGRQSRIATLRLEKPVVFETTDIELELFEKHATYFARWGVLYDVQQNSTSTHKVTDKRKITIRTLPPAISERCVAEPRLIIDLLRTEVWQRGSRTKSSAPLTPPELDKRKHSWLTEIGDCPQGILEILKSRACRSAIMFNDVLSLNECRTLLSKLAECAFPFQCAHGRPSMVPLVSLGRLTMGVKEAMREDDGAMRYFVNMGQKSKSSGDDYVQSFRKWRGKDESE